MSENRITDPDVLLQQELDAMAAEVPDMPASFRNGWREAVREDARMRAEAEAARPAAQDRPTPAAGPAGADRPTVTEFPTAAARPAGTDRPAAAHPAAGRLLRTRRWVPWVCAAAMMVFLVGGTMLTRNTLSPRLHASHTAAPTALAGKNAPPAEQLFEQELAEEAREAEEAAPDDMVLVPAGAGDKLQHPVFNQVPAEDAPGEDTPVEDTPVEDTWQADEKLQLLLAPNGTGAPAADLMEGSVEAEGDAEVAAVPSSRDAEKREAPGLRSRILDFLEDMGAFVLAALPYLAGAAVLAAGIILFRRRK